jgi:hypothetical protein
LYLGWLRYYAGLPGLRGAHLSSNPEGASVGVGQLHKNKPSWLCD